MGPFRSSVASVHEFMREHTSTEGEQSFVRTRTV